MATRGQIICKSEAYGDVVLYQHWDSLGLVESLSKALHRGRSRWGDPLYLNRVIFCELIQYDTLGDTGWGIGGTRLYDVVDVTLVVDHDAESVMLSTGETKSFAELADNAFRFAEGAPA